MNNSNILSNQPIGIFDSGLGGLTAVRELKKILPFEDIVYFGDTGRVPYGSRSKEIIKKYALSDIKFLLSKNVKMIIGACGTASTVIDDEMISGIDVLFTGVVEPSAKAAYNKSKTKNIGIIATNATIKSGKYGYELKKIDEKCNVIGKACPLFVPLVENGYTDFDNKVTRIIAQDYLKEFINNKNIDTLILGCTHYPILENIIKDILGDEVNIIDSGKQAALKAKKMLTESNLLNKDNLNSTIKYYVSDSIENFSFNAKEFLGELKVDDVEKIDIECY